MSSTLSERIKERMAATGLNNADLATAAGVKQPTSFNWGSGKTKNIKGEPLLLAAKALGVTPEWLATGKGPKLRDHVYGASDPQDIELSFSIVSEPAAAFNVVHTSAVRAKALVDQLPETALEEAILHMEWLLAKHKKTGGTNGDSDPVPGRKKMHK